MTNFEPLKSQIEINRQQRQDKCGRIRMFLIDCTMFFAIIAAMYWVAIVVYQMGAGL